MRFSLPLQSHPAVYVRQDETLAVPADLSPILGWQADPCGHGYFSGGFDVLCCQVWIFVDSCFC
jgi:hypothetical protein